jgi:hypothetical protein
MDNIWTADGWAGDNTFWRASGQPHRERPWTADGWIGWFTFAAPIRQRQGSTLYQPRAVPRK